MPKDSLLGGSIAGLNPSTCKQQIMNKQQGEVFRLEMLSFMLEQRRRLDDAG